MQSEVPDARLLECVEAMAAGGNRLAQWAAGEHALNVDDGEAMWWFRSLAEGGDRDAQLILAGLNGRGQGISANRERAYRLFEQAIRNTAVARWHEARESVEELKREIAPAETHRLLLPAARHGSQLAQLALGHLAAGEAREGESGAGFQWYRRAALHGNHEAMQELVWREMPPMARFISPPVRESARLRDWPEGKVPEWRRRVGRLSGIVGALVLFILLQWILAGLGLPLGSAEDETLTPFFWSAALVGAGLGWRIHRWVVSGRPSGNLTMRQKWLWRIGLSALTLVVVLLGPLWFWQMSETVRTGLAVAIIGVALWLIGKLVDWMQWQEGAARNRVRSGSSMGR